MKVISFSGNKCHLMHSDSPECTKHHKCQHIVPVVIPIEGLLCIIDVFFAGDEGFILFVEYPFHFLHDLVLVKGQSVDWAEEEISHDVGKWPSCAYCDQGCPENHNGTFSGRDLWVQNGQNATCPRKTDQELSGSQKSCEIFFMGQIMETVESPTCPLVVLEFFVVTVKIWSICNQNVNPVEKYS